MTLLTEIVTAMHSVNFLFFPIVSIDCNLTRTFCDNVKYITNSTLLIKFKNKCREYEKYFNLYHVFEIL